MPLFKGRSSLLEVQNRALIKTARERAARIDELERDLQQATKEVERLTLERDFYYKKASALEKENRQLTESATNYSLGSKLERELNRIDPDGAPAPVRAQDRSSCARGSASFILVASS
jgi:uncharacterized coiled-coil DUF342 family protein